jgi:hypothetical protein
VYLGSEKELQKQIQRYFAGILELAPDSTKVLRYEKDDPKALDGVKELGRNL